MSGVDTPAAIAFVTLMLEPLPHTLSHYRARDELLTGDLEALVWGLATVAKGVIDALADAVSLPASAVVQVAAQTAAGGDLAT